MEVFRKDEVEAIQLLLERGYVVRAISKEDVEFQHPELRITDAEWARLCSVLNSLDEGHDINGIGNMNFLDALDEVREEMSAEETAVA